MNTSQFIFPIFNALIFTILFAVIGVLLGDFLLWTILGVLSGFAIGWVAEALLRRFVPDTWLFRRRVLLMAVLELIVIIYLVGPFAYVQYRLLPYNYELCCATPADFGAEYNALTIPSEEGIEIAVWYIPSEIEDAPTIIISHGAGGNRMGGLWYAEELYNANYAVLLYDQRGLGESVGGHPSIGWFDTADVSYIIDYLVAEYDVNPNRIGGVGISLGGNILLAVADSDERLRAVWADGISPQHRDDFPPPRNAVEYFDWSLNYMVLMMLKWQVGFDFEPLGVQMSQIDAPVLIIAGEAEELEGRLLEVFDSELPQTTQIWEIPEVGHVGGPGHIPEEYSRRMIEFFENVFSE